MAERARNSMYQRPDWDNRLMTHTQPPARPWNLRNALQDAALRGTAMNVAALSELAGGGVPDPRVYAPGAGMLPSPIGDVAGLGQDASMYLRDPESRSLLNYGMSLAALLPGVPARVYHGTGRAFDAFSDAAKKTTGGGLNKYGAFVSENPKVASRYAADFFGDQGANVRPMNVTVQKPLNLTAQEYEKLQSVVGKLDRGEPLTELEDIGLEMLLKKHGIEYGGHPIEAIKAAGFDAIQKDAGRFGMAEQEALIFDPTKLKTAFGPKP